MKSKWKPTKKKKKSGSIAPQTLIVFNVHKSEAVACRWRCCLLRKDTWKKKFENDNSLFARDIFPGKWKLNRCDQKSEMWFYYLFEFHCVLCLPENSMRLKCSTQIPELIAGRFFTSRVFSRSNEFAALGWMKITSGISDAPMSFEIPGGKNSAVNIFENCSKLFWVGLVTPSRKYERFFDWLRLFCYSKYEIFWSIFFFIVFK